MNKFIFLVFHVSLFSCCSDFDCLLVGAVFGFYSSFSLWFIKHSLASCPPLGLSVRLVESSWVLVAPWAFVLLSQPLTPLPPYFYLSGALLLALVHPLHSRSLGSAIPAHFSSMGTFKNIPLTSSALFSCWWVLWRPKLTWAALWHLLRTAAFGVPLCCPIKKTEKTRK